MVGHPQAQQDHREGELFRLLAENIKDYAIFALDVEGRVVSWSKGAQRLLGYAEDEVVGQTTDRFFTPEDRQRGVPESELRQALDTGRGEDDRWHVRKDGSRFWSSGVVTPLWDEGGRLRGYAKVMRDLTEQKRAEQAVREQRELLRVTLASIGDAVLATDTEGRITSLNPVAQSLTGWTQEDARGQPADTVVRLVDELSRMPVECPAARALRDGHVVGLANHTVLVARDGAERPVADCAAPIRDTQGNTLGAVLVFRDDTERRRAEHSLRDALAYAEAIVETVREPLVVLDADLRVRSANTSFYRTFRLTPGEAEGRALYELGDREWDIPGLRKLLEQILPAKKALEGFRVDREFAHIGRKALRLNARQLSRGGAGPGMILLAVEDVTERTRAEERLRAEQAKLRRQLSLTQTITDRAAEALYLLDAEGRVTFMNPAAEEMFGWTRGEIGDRTLCDVIHHRPADGSPLPDEGERGECPLVRVFTSGAGLHNHEDVFYRKDGTAVPVYCSNAAVRADGRTTGAVLIVRDITEKKQLEEALRSRAEDLAEVNTRKDEFLAMLGHELRNPLSPILTALTLMRQATPESPLLRQARVTIERQVGQMTRLVDDLLDVSRISRGMMQLSKERVELRAVVERAVEAVRPFLETRKHQLTLSLPAEPVWLEADPARLQQVLANLLHNAGKYTDPGGQVWLAAEHRARKDVPSPSTLRPCNLEGSGGDVPSPSKERPRSLEGSGEVVVRVKDTGIGISAEMLPRVFDLFAQEGRSADRAAGGLGIGLTLVQRLTQMHGGTVEAASAGPGRGSEFTVRLPVLAALAPPRSENVETTRQAGPSLRILLVDDLADATDLLALLLRMWGHEVQVAYTGPAGLEAAEVFRPDVVLLDIGLPGMSGYDVARRIRERARGKVPLLVAMTGYGQEADRRKAREAGFDHHLTKPIHPDAVQALLAPAPG
jgi:PAS domain S-box-containing protein